MHVAFRVIKIGSSGQSGLRVRVRSWALGRGVMVRRRYGQLTPAAPSTVLHVRGVDIEDAAPRARASASRARLG